MTADEAIERCFKADAELPLEVDVRNEVYIAAVPVLIAEIESLRERLIEHAPREEAVRYWRNKAEARAKPAQMEYEVLDFFDNEINRGQEPVDAFLFAVREWDC